MESTKKQELIYFEQLKYTLQKEVETSLNIRKEFKEWSGSDIQTFQIDLEEKCKSTVSEKWVYLHFKNTSDKLPRVDVLNLLSQYCGFKNWDDFKHQNEAAPKAEKKNRSKLIYFTLAVVILAGFGVYALFPKKQKLVVVFTDAYTLESVSQNNLRIAFGKNKGRMKRGLTVFEFRESDTLKVNGAYYKELETFVRKEEAKDTLLLKLYPDDYAMMLNYFSRTEHKNWEKRQRQLQKAIHNDAVIFQSHPKHDGIEILNKEEFIDRLILPVNSLKNLEIQDIVYEDDQIINLRFVQKDN
ncbi:hypothetical protein [Owenweeksia hongkongensis]|uniref:hypothetical protein n=1 Tax=Owenweeksia hongkongensis TaxID=253245 RepID=UPI003A935C8E